MQRVKVEMFVDWEPCEGNGDIVISDVEDLKDYIDYTLQSNMNYDKVKALIMAIEIPED